MFWTQSYVSQNQTVLRVQSYYNLSFQCTYAYKIITFSNYLYLLSIKTLYLLYKSCILQIWVHTLIITSSKQHFGPLRNWHSIEALPLCSLRRCPKTCQSHRRHLNGLMRCCLSSLLECRLRALAD